MQRAFTVDEFCRIYKLGRTKFYQELNARRLKTVKVGAKRLVRADDAEEWLAGLSSDEAA